jgi:hypothetical protein
MSTHTAINLRDYSERWVYPNGECVDFEIEGADGRHQLGLRVAKDLEKIHDQAVHILTSFMKDTGLFDLNSVQVFASKTMEQGDFLLSFSFTADRDEHEYGYTRFDVCFMAHEPPGPLYGPCNIKISFH